MNEYVYPQHDAEFVLAELIDFESLCIHKGQADVNSELASLILTQAAKLGEQVLAPLNTVGDTHHPQLTVVDGLPAVQETAGFAQAYREYCQGGWASLTAKQDDGGQNLPNVLATAVNEIWHSANLAFALCPLLNQGAIAAVSAHASASLKSQFLAKMISGDWPGTMNLTESGAGTDLAAIKTKALPNGDHYLIKGQKIFITWGDHQMSDNIVHLVLARLPQAPPGVKGISLFIVPKFILNEEGVPDQRNDVFSAALEHKLGIHASPTCVMQYGENKGAVGYLVGEEHQGLSYMFTMMNHARQAVGLQGLAISEAAYQKAVKYAKERIQGATKEGAPCRIIQFPDVRRMLMQMKSSTQAMRALCLVAAAEIDRGNSQRAELLTPIVKGWITELAQEVTSLGIQIHGGMGYIEETGAAQFYRDARILTIYEGTTGVQALDFVNRKVLLNAGESLQLLLADMTQDIAEFKRQGDQFSTASAQLAAAHQRGVAARQWLLDHAKEPDDVAGMSVSIMMLFGYLCGGWLMAKSAIRAQKRLAESTENLENLKAKLVTSQFYCEHILVRVEVYYQKMLAGSSSIMGLDESQF